MADPLSGHNIFGTINQAAFIELLASYDQGMQAVADARADLKERKENIRDRLGPAGYKAFMRTAKDRETSGEERELEDQWYRRQMAWLQKPVGFQPAFDLKSDDPGLAALNTMELKRIDSEGFEAGRAGHSRDRNTYTPGTEAFARWDTAWLRGQAEIASSLANNTSAADAARAAGANGNGGQRRRGRPPGSKNRSKEPAAQQEPAEQIH